MHVRMELNIDFYQLDEASLFLETNASSDLQFFTEIFFSSFALRQLKNLGWIDVSLATARLLSMVEDDIEQLIQYSGPDHPKIVPYSGKPGRKRFKVILDARDSEVGLKVLPKGFGILGRGINYYAPHTVVLLLRFLGEKYLDDKDSLRRLAVAAHLSGDTLLRRDVSTRNYLHLANSITEQAIR